MKTFNNYWLQLTPLTQQLGKVLAINIIILNIILPLVSWVLTTFKSTVLFHTVQFLTAQIFFSKGYDSWTPMHKAFDYLNLTQQKTLYDEMFFVQQVKFQYPPTSLLVYKFLSNIVKLLQPIGISWLDLLQAISWIFVVAMIFFVVKIFNHSLEKNTKDSEEYSSKFDSNTRNIILICLAITFYPVIKSYTLGQIQTWLNSMFAIIIWLWIKEKKGIAGVLAGTMCLIKPQYAVILLWGILRKQWSFSLAFATTALIGLLISISQFGIANHLDYLKVLSFLSQHGEAYFHNQSVNGLLNRFLFNGNNLIFEEHAFPPFNLIVYIGTVISSAILIGMALFWPIKTNKKGSIIDLAIIVLTCTMASPIAWEHHYGILLPIYAFLLPYLLREKIFGKMTIIYLYISYLLCSNDFAIAKVLASVPLLNIFQSYLFAGSLIVLLCLHVLVSRRANEIGFPSQQESGESLSTSP